MQHRLNNHRPEPRQLVLELNGLPLIGGGEEAYAVQAAATDLPEELRATLDWLRSLQTAGVAVLSAQFDEVTQLLNALGIRYTRLAPEDLPLTGATVVFAGCPHRFFRLDAQDVDPFLARGGVLVSSDRAAYLPGINRYLPVLSGRPPRVCRMAYDRLDNPCGLYPPVVLEPGHRPLDGAALAESDARVMAAEAPAGAPLVTLVRAGGGAILHATPHWLQAGPLEHATAVEQRPLRHVPTLAHIGNSYPRLSLGRYLGQRAMLELLLSGIAAATESVQSQGASNRQEG